MQRTHGRLRSKSQKGRWGLSALLLLALAGISLVSEPESRGAETASALHPATDAADVAPAFADRAYALSVEGENELFSGKPPESGRRKPERLKTGGGP